MDRLVLVPPLGRADHTTLAQRLRQELIGYLATRPGEALPEMPTEEQFEQALAERNRIAAAAALEAMAATNEVGRSAPAKTDLSHAPHKSVLLMRLLQGHQALRHPPPVSHGYPNYELIESDEGTEHPVSIWFRPGAKNILINQTSWQIAASNEPATAIQSMMEAGHASFDGEKFLALVARAPTWSVQTGNWPIFELVASTRIIVGRSDRVERLSAPSYETACSGAWGPAQALSDALWTKMHVGCWALKTPRSPEVAVDDGNGPAAAAHMGAPTA